MKDSSGRKIHEDLSSAAGSRPCVHCGKCQSDRHVHEPPGIETECPQRRVDTRASAQQRRGNITKTLTETRMKGEKGFRENPHCRKNTYQSYLREESFLVDLWGKRDHGDKSSCISTRRHSTDNGSSTPHKVRQDKENDTPDTKTTRHKSAKIGFRILE